MEAGAYRQFAEQEETHWWFKGRRSIFAHVIQNLFSSSTQQGPGERRVLDLGCGMGGMFGILEEVGSVYGLDTSSEALAFCAERGYRRVFKGHGSHLPLPDASLDLLTAFDTIEHIPEEMETLRECRRVLKPGGWMVISVPAYQWLFTHQDKMVHHQRRYTAGQMRRKLESAGFRVEKTSYINFFLFPLILPIVLAMKAKQWIFPPDDETFFTNASIKVPAWVNRILFAIFAAERHVLSRVSVPAGHSLLVLARRPAKKS